MSAPTTIRGRLVADPELTFLNSGNAKASLRVVTSRRYKDANGDWQDKDTTFWTVTCWRQLAENVAESLVKGMEVIVTGDVKSREYETQQGEKRTVWEVEATDIGPSLARATAKVAKVSREQAGAGRDAFTAARGAMTDDPWQTQAQQTEVPF